MPNYPALAAQGIYTDAATGVRVFAGPARRDVLHRSRRGVRHAEPAALPAAAHRRTRTPTTSTRSASIASAAPTSARSRSRCRSRASRATANLPQRRRIRSSACTRAPPAARSGCFGRRRAPTTSGPFVQVSRMGNPLVNELIINTPPRTAGTPADARGRSAVPGLLQESGASRPRSELGATAYRSCRSTARRRRTAPT